MQHKWYGFNQLVKWGYYFGIVCMDNGQGLTDSPDKLLIFQLLYHNLYQVQHKMLMKIANQQLKHRKNH